MASRLSATSRVMVLCLSLGVGLGAAQAPRRAVAQALPPAETIGTPSPVAGNSAPSAGPAAPITATGPQEQVVDVRILGNTATPLTKLPRLATRPGSLFDPLTVEEDVRTLIKSRKFVNVQPQYQQAPGGLVVIFQVVERPLFHYVKYLGNKKVRDKTLDKQTELTVGGSMDPYAVTEAKQKIESYYREKGFNHVHVEIMEGDKIGDRGAVFVIHEGQAQKVAWTNFVGNKIADDARLRTQIASKPGFMWLFKGYADRKTIDDDIKKLTAYYRALGFFRAKIGRELEWNEKENWLQLTFVIDEGPRYKVRSVTLVGNEEFETAYLTHDMKLRPNDYFDQLKMTKDVAMMKDIYGADGRVFTDIEPDPRFLETPGELDLVYTITEGDRYRIGRINVHVGGENPHTREKTVLNRMTLRPGDVVDTRKLRSDERRIKGSGLFLNDPAQGVAPKIVFSPPQAGDLETNVAGKPKKPGKPADDRFRSQSPDGQDKFVDLNVHGQWIHDDGQPLPSKQPEPVEWSPVQKPMAAVASPGAAKQAKPTFSVSRASSHDMAVRQSYDGLASRRATLTTTNKPVARFQSPDGGRAITIPPSNAPSNVSPNGQPMYSNIAPQPGATPIFAAPAAGGAVQTIPPNNAAESRIVYQGQGLPVGQQPAPLVGQQIVPEDIGPGQPGPVYGPPLPTTDYPSIAPDIYVSETQTGRLMFGVGINSDAGLIGQILLEEQNFDWTRVPDSWEDWRTGRAFRGAGQRFRIEAAPGTQLQRYVISFTEPYLMDTPVALGLSASYFDRRYRDWDETRFGGRVSLGYQITPDLTITGAVRAEQVEISNPRTPSPPDLLAVLGENQLYGFRGSIAHDTRDSAFAASEGHYVELAFEQVVGTFEYPRETLDARKYFLLGQRPDGSGRHTLMVGTKLGFSGPDTPIYDRFFAGGFTTLRGFNYRGASPKELDVIVGGNFQFINTVEYTYPITANDVLKGVVFTDFGTVEQDARFDSDTFRTAIGAGLRISVPALGPAPIALDLSLPITHAPGDDTQNFSFFIGVNR